MLAGLGLCKLLISDQVKVHIAPQCIMDRPVAVDTNAWLATRIETRLFDASLQQPATTWNERGPWGAIWLSLP